MRKSKIKIAFSVKKKEELKDLTYEELLEYTKNLTDDWHKQKRPKKNSGNSSIAPSSDISKAPKKNQSLRRSNGKKVGGQKGRMGKTLIQTDKPDEIVELDYKIHNCSVCRTSLLDTLKQLKERRQVLDLELSSIGTKITEYQSFSKLCPVCKYENHDSTFALNVTPNISYGATIKAMVSYLSASQYISHHRIVKLFEDLFNLRISQGSISNLIKQTGKLSLTDISSITKALESSLIVGIDETGCKIDGFRYWHWTFQNETNTLVVADKSRGTKVINDTFEDGFANACVVHDNYASYNSLTCKGEQLCLAHKLRDLNYAIECDDTTLMKELKDLFKEAMRDHKLPLTQGQRVVLKKKYEEVFAYLLTRPVIQNSETHKQIKSLSRSRDKIFTFLLDENIPPDNNASERAIRNVKVKLKVSGQFKSLDGAKNYANLRSIIDTSRKRGLNEFESLLTIAKGNCVF